MLLEYNDTIFLQKRRSLFTFAKRSLFINKISKYGFLSDNERIRCDET